MIYVDGCKRKRGSLKSFSVDDVYLGEIGFALGADTVASFEAGVMCKVYEHKLKKWKKTTAKW